VEDLAVKPAFWKERRVFLTGHTGFKGSWLSLWLADMGAKVWGYALPPSTDPSLFDLTSAASRLTGHTIGDIRDVDALRRAMRAADPEVVIHMAAQPLVRESYADPLGTYGTNVMGTAHLLECVRQQSGVRAIVVVTTDKCYENNDWVWPYRESDRLGGHDPYSNSKACAELVTQCYRRSFFQKNGGARIATARAGNVIGGGDWSKDRLVPDIVCGYCREGCVRLRNPESVRPWQHVLDPLAGYLLLAERLCASADYGESWNFGPDSNDTHSVRDVAEAMLKAFGGGSLVDEAEINAPHEARLLTLDCSKARARLGWKPKLAFAETVALTADWYAAWHGGEDMYAVTLSQIREFAKRG
jgi:CDP-glucose 4,6-dehydratase